MDDKDKQRLSCALEFFSDENLITKAFAFVELWERLDEARALIATWRAEAERQQALANTSGYEGEFRAAATTLNECADALSLALNANEEPEGQEAND